jgi:hypothetical protein
MKKKSLNAARREREARATRRRILPQRNTARRSRNQNSLSSIRWRRGLGRGGWFKKEPLSSVLSPLVPRGERKKIFDKMSDSDEVQCIVRKDFSN